jgi:hypothetical protein
MWCKKVIISLFDVNILKKKFEEEYYMDFDK